MELVARDLRHALRKLFSGLFEQVIVGLAQS